jgi:hypothetical protein
MSSRAAISSLSGSARAWLAQVDHARAEGPGLDQPQVEALGERREVRGAAAKDDRDDERAVFVDQVLRDSGRGEARPALTRRSRSGPTSLATSSVANRAVPSTELSVRENTTFGMGRQMRANSSSASSWPQSSRFNTRFLPGP